MCPTVAVVDRSGVCACHVAEVRVSRPLSGHDNDCVVAQPLLLLGILEGETGS